jgi:hypothetical protein
MPRASRGISYTEFDFRETEKYDRQFPSGAVRLMHQTGNRLGRAAGTRCAARVRVKLARDAPFRDRTISLVLRPSARRRVM